MGFVPSLAEETIRGATLADRPRCGRARSDQKNYFFFLAAFFVDFFAAFLVAFLRDAFFAMLGITPSVADDGRTSRSGYATRGNNVQAELARPVLAADRAASSVSVTRSMHSSSSARLKGFRKKPATASSNARLRMLAVS